MKGLNLSFLLVPLDFIYDLYLRSSDRSKTTGQTAKIRFYAIYTHGGYGLGLHSEG